MDNRQAKKGVLLIEVLIAASILAVGIVACLRVFMEATHASSLLKEQKAFQEMLDVVYFKWFLDPTNVDVDSGKQINPVTYKNPSLSSELAVSLMGQETEKEADAKKTVKKPVLQTLLKKQTKYFNTQFRIFRINHKQVYEFQGIVFRYGDQKK